MMKALTLKNDYDRVEFTLNTDIPTGKSMKIQPHEKEFYTLTDQKQK